MALRPIDMTITIQNASEATRAGHTDAGRPETVQQQFAEKLQREVQHDDQQVLQTNKTEDNRVDRDGRGNAGGGSSKKKKKPSSNQGTKQSSATSGGKSMFDVSV